MARILIVEQIEADAVALLRAAGHQVTERFRMTPEALRLALRETEAVVVRTHTRLNAEDLDGATSLRLIGRPGAGLDNIDLAAASANGIEVINTPGANSVAAAEHTCGLIIGLVRHIAAASQQMKSGGYERRRWWGIELEGRVLGIVGLGRVGSRVARRMQAFGMTVLATDPYLAAERFEELAVEQVELAELLRRSDIITVHTPLTDETRGMIGAAELEQCRPSVYLINCARGGIVNEHDLLAALNSGQVVGAALDVLTEEPPETPALRFLVTHPQVLSTPHLGGATVEAQRRVCMQLAEAIVEKLRHWGKSPSNGSPFYGAMGE